MTTSSIDDHRDSKEPPVDLPSLNEWVTRTIHQIGFPDGSIEINLVDAPVIRRLNADYRQLDEPTTVLSFPHLEWLEPLVPRCKWRHDEPDGPPVIIGEIFVAPDIIRSRADTLGDSFRTYLYFLIVHSLLHLAGYQHGSDADARIMEQRENEIMDILNRQDQRGDME